MLSPVRKSPRMPKCNGSTIPSRWGHSGEGTTPLLDPPSSSSYERLSLRKSSPTLPTPGAECRDTDHKISLSPFTSRLPTSLEVDRRLGLHQAHARVVVMLFIMDTIQGA